MKSKYTAQRPIVADEIKYHDRPWESCDITINSAAHGNRLMLDGATHIHVVGYGDYVLWESALNDMLLG